MTAKDKLHDIVDELSEDEAHELLRVLEETLAVMDDAELVARVREGERAIDAGDVVPLEHLQRRYSASSR